MRIGTLGRAGGVVSAIANAGCPRWRAPGALFLSRRMLGKATESSPMRDAITATAL